MEAGYPIFSTKRELLQLRIGPVVCSFNYHLGQVNYLRRILNKEGVSNFAPATTGWCHWEDLQS